MEIGSVILLGGIFLVVIYRSGLSKEFKENNLEFYDLKKWAARGSEGATEIINRFISCVLEKKTPFVTPEEGVQCMKVLDAARRSAKTGTWEKVY